MFFLFLICLIFVLSLLFSVFFFFFPLLPLSTLPEGLVLSFFPYTIFNEVYYLSPKKKKKKWRDVGVTLEFIPIVNTIQTYISLMRMSWISWSSRVIFSSFACYAVLRICTTQSSLIRWILLLLPFSILGCWWALIQLMQNSKHGRATFHSS